MLKSQSVVQQNFRMQILWMRKHQVSLLNWWLKKILRKLRTFRLKWKWIRTPLNWIQRKEVLNWRETPLNVTLKHISTHTPHDLNTLWGYFSCYPFNRMNYNISKEGKSGETWGNNLNEMYHFQHIITDLCRKEYLNLVVVIRLASKFDIKQPSYCQRWTCLSNGQKPILLLTAFWSEILDNWQFWH